MCRSVHVCKGSEDMGDKPARVFQLGTLPLLAVLEVVFELCMILMFMKVFKDI